MNRNKRKPYYNEEESPPTRRRKPIEEDEEDNFDDFDDEPKGKSNGTISWPASSDKKSYVSSGKGSKGSKSFEPEFRFQESGTEESDDDGYDKVLEKSLTYLSNSTKSYNNKSSRDFDDDEDRVSYRSRSSREEEDNGIYKSSLVRHPPKEKVSKPTETRIDNLRHILEGSKLKPLVDLDVEETEVFESPKLNKKTMDVSKLFQSMEVELHYVKSGTTGHTFKAVSIHDPNKAFAVKVCAYPKEDEYGTITNNRRPENAEIRMIKLLSYFIFHRITPHLVLPLGTFNTSINTFIKLPSKIFKDTDFTENASYQKFVERYQKGELEDFVSVLVSEWATGGDLLDYIKSHHKEMTLEEWKIIFFQIIYTLAKIHEKYPNFRHNDLKPNNLLMKITNPAHRNRKCSYNVKNTRFKIPCIKQHVMIWDFDFSCIAGLIENNKVNSEWTKKMNITNKKNRYYDIHYFFNTLISKRFFPEFSSGSVPQEVVDFIYRVVPEQYRGRGRDPKPDPDEEPDRRKKKKNDEDDNLPERDVNKRGRIKVNVEYTYPEKILLTDEFFSEYKIR